MTTRKKVENIVPETHSTKNEVSKAGVDKMNKKNTNIEKEVSQENAKNDSQSKDWLREQIMNEIDIRGRYLITVEETGEAWTVSNRGQKIAVLLSTYRKSCELAMKIQMRTGIQMSVEHLDNNGFKRASQ